MLMMRGLARRGARGRLSQQPCITVHRSEPPPPPGSASAGMRTDEHAHAIATVSPTSMASDLLLNMCGIAVRSHQKPQSTKASSGNSSVVGATRVQDGAAVVADMTVGGVRPRMPTVSAVFARPRRCSRGKRSQEFVSVRVAPLRQWLPVSGQGSIRAAAHDTHNVLGCVADRDRVDCTTAWITRLQFPRGEPVPTPRLRQRAISCATTVPSSSTLPCTRRAPSTGC